MTKQVQLRFCNLHYKIKKDFFITARTPTGGYAFLLYQRYHRSSIMEG